MGCELMVKKDESKEGKVKTVQRQEVSLVMGVPLVIVHFLGIFVHCK